MEENNPNKSIDAVHHLDALLKKSYEHYYQINEELKKFSGRLLEGEELKAGEELAIQMEMIYRKEIEPVASFIALRHPDILKMAHNHGEWRTANIKANERPSILDPNLVH